MSSEYTYSGSVEDTLAADDLLCHFVTSQTLHLVVAIKKKLRIVDIVQYQNPLSILTVLQLVIYKSKNISLGIPLPK
jgi:hypothetical protein